MAEITLWKPEPDLIVHQALGKAAEETAELAKELARALIQGLDAADPSTGKPNRQKIMEELADFDAAFQWLRQVAGLHDYDEDRATAKLRGFERWQQMLEADRG